MVNFVVVEDNIKHRNKIEKIIVSFMMRNKIEFDITFFEDINNELKTFIKRNKEESIYIVDLELPSGDGVEVAKIVRNTNNDWKSPIIICSAHTTLLYEVYKLRLQILDFVCKCFDVEKNLVEVLYLCLKMLNKENFYFYRHHSVDECIPYNKINYIQRLGRKTIIVTTKKVFECNVSVVKIKNQLPDYFINSTKGTLINANNIKRIDWNEGCAYFKDGSKDYVISRKHKKEIMKNVVV